MQPPPCSYFLAVSGTAFFASVTAAFASAFFASATGAPVDGLAGVAGVAAGAAGAPPSRAGAQAGPEGRGWPTEVRVTTAITLEPGAGLLLRYLVTLKRGRGACEARAASK